MARFSCSNNVQTNFQATLEMILNYLQLSLQCSQLYWSRPVGVIKNVINLLIDRKTHLDLTDDEE